jgi:hypothetical protein
VVGLLEQGDELGWAQLPAEPLSLSLHNLAELDLETAGEIQLQSAQNNPGSSTLAALGVDTDDSLVVSSDILGVEGKVRHPPLVVIRNTSLLAQRETLLDSVLVTSTEGTKGERKVRMYAAYNVSEMTNLVTRAPP